MLLAQAGYEFEVIAPPDWVECGICSSRSPAELVAESSFRKAKHVSRLIDTGIVLAADTVAECGGQILGKPADRDHARHMLKLMEGREHRVLTGVTLWQQPGDKYVTHIEQTLLKMDVFDEDELEAYLDSDDWIGKAGAFGYQDGLDWVHIIEGSGSNVVGLPIEKLADWLPAFVAGIQG
jgi:septum formation protein